MQDLRTPEGPGTLHRRPNTKALSGCQGDQRVVSKQGGGVQGEPVLSPAGDERLTNNGQGKGNVLAKPIYVTVQNPMPVQRR